MEEKRQGSRLRREVLEVPGWSGRDAKMRVTAKTRESKWHMSSGQLTITYVGGPTAILELGGIRLLTDPTFDAAGGEYPSGPAILRKLSGPAINLQDIGAPDYVLLSHDQHFDNLDRTGRQILRLAKKVLTTEEGASRLGENALGLKNWQSVDLAASDGQRLRIVGTPARHGPAGLDRGSVTGFVFFLTGAIDRAVYVSGDTVWYEGVAEVARCFPVRVAILHLGAARVPEAGPFHLTMTADEALLAARAFKDASIVPIHFEGWAHFSEGRKQIEQKFAAAGMNDRLCWPMPGQAIQVSI